MEKIVKIKDCEDLIRVKLFYCSVKPNKYKLSDDTPIGLWEDIINKKIYHTNDFIEIYNV